MFEDFTLIAVRIAAALVAGAAIGFERGFHGRPAGFRTHALVCLTSSLLMLVTVFQGSWMTEIPADAIRTDPTRMAQGIMTGIGFLGAGVIFKEGTTVRGLTTAATIWITSAIGILIGIGFYIPAIAGAVATLFVLSGMRWLESRLPKTFHASLSVRFGRESALSETELRDMVGKNGFTVQNFSHRLTGGGEPDCPHRLTAGVISSIYRNHCGCSSMVEQKLPKARLPSIRYKSLSKISSL